MLFPVCQTVPARGPGTSPSDIEFTTELQAWALKISGGPDFQCIPLGHRYPDRKDGRATDKRQPLCGYRGNRDLAKPDSPVLWL